MGKNKKKLQPSLLLYVVGISMGTRAPTNSMSSITVFDESSRAFITRHATRFSHLIVSCRSHATSAHSMN